MYICVDFDGTIVDHVFPEIGEPVPFAIECMQHYAKQSCKIILYTMRSNTEERGYLSEAVDYLLSVKVPLFGANHNKTQSTWSKSPKVYGQAYIDDAAVGVPLIQPEGFRRPCVDWVKIDKELSTRFDIDPYFNHYLNEEHPDYVQVLHKVYEKETNTKI